MNFAYPQVTSICTAPHRTAPHRTAGPQVPRVLPPARCAPRVALRAETLPHPPGAPELALTKFLVARYPCVHRAMRCTNGGAIVAVEVIPMASHMTRGGPDGSGRDTMGAYSHASYPCLTITRLGFFLLFSVPTTISRS